MKKISSVLLAISLMLSLSLVSFASPQIVPCLPGDDGYIEPFNGVVPYSLVPSSEGIAIVTSVNSSSFTYSSLIDDGNGLLVGSGAVLSAINSSNVQLNNMFYIGQLESVPGSQPNYWWNFIGKITDANGYVLQASDINNLGLRQSAFSNTLLTNLGSAEPASDNLYQFDDGYLQIALSHDTWDSSNRSCFIYVNISNSSVVAPLSFEVEKFELYSSESSTTAYPFTFGAGAHTVTPDTPVEKDPSDHTQYGTASDQVEWYNDAYGSAVNPELGNKMSEATDMILQQEEIESQVIDGLNQYSTAVDPANLTFPTQILNGLSFIGTTFMSAYDGLGDIGFVISFSMMLGVVLVLIGRGEGALARGMASSARAERNRIAEEKRVMYERRRYGQERNR